MSATEQPFGEWVRLEQPRLGSRVVAVSDEFFGAAERLIAPSDPVFIADRYDDHGKWMDGWESRRRRGPGHDACTIRLGVPGVIHGFDIDTAHFTGNYPPEAAVDVCRTERDVPAEEDWRELLGTVALTGNTHHFHAVDSRQPVTHVRLRIYPDGGVARLRIYGEVVPDPKRWPRNEPVDLVALRNGGRAIAASDEHFGSRHNLNLDGRGINMGDGWETARRRGPGNDWVIFRLGAIGVVDELEIDTAWFKGNYPARASVDALAAADTEALRPADLSSASLHWRGLLPETPLEMDQVHRLGGLARLGPVSYLRLNIFPDGGVSRFRAWGAPVSRDLE